MSHDYSLTFQNSDSNKLIAIIDGGKYSTKRVYITNDGSSPTEVVECDPFSILTENWFRSQKSHLKTSDLIRLQHAIRKGRGPEDDELNAVYEIACKYLQDRMKKELKIPDGRIRPCLGKDPTIRCYVCGATGSGKTTWCVNFIKEMLRRRPKLKFWVFSVLNEDEVLDKLNPTRIKLDMGMVEKPIKLEELENSVVLFDDVETIPSKKVRDAVQNLRDRCLSEGRHHNISTMCTNHQITDYKKTRGMILESEFVTFFPQSGGNNSILRLLNTYIGLNKKQIARLMSLPSRWVTIYNRAPLTCLYESGVFLINDMIDLPKAGEAKQIIEKQMEIEPIEEQYEYPD